MSPSDRPKPPHPAKAPDGPDPDVPPSDEELGAAEALRRALDAPPSANRDVAKRTADDGARADAAFAQSVRAAAAPQTLSADRHQQILARALSAKVPRETAGGRVRELRPPKSKVVAIVFGSAASLLVMAAAVALVIRGAAPDGRMASKATAERGAPALAFSRSTADLFPEGIPRSGGTTDRVDRIALARAQDFRQNQFARWRAP